MGLLSLVATGALADSQHYATASTKKEAKRLATADARATARISALCHRPARQVDECVKVEGGFRCRADSSASFLTCRHAGWVHDESPHPSAWANRVLWASDSWPSNPWSSTSEYSSLYGRSLSSGGPPLPPPFPNN
jgi:hypothetical protein